VSRSLDLPRRYREGLQRIIDAKIKGEQVVTPAVEVPSNVVNLMDALKKSLNAVSAKKQPAKAALPKRVIFTGRGTEAQDGVALSVQRRGADTF
jgi:hypothetical protein